MRPCTVFSKCHVAIVALTVGLLCVSCSSGSPGKSALGSRAAAGASSTAPTSVSTSSTVSASSQSSTLTSNDLVAQVAVTDSSQYSYGLSFDISVGARADEDVADSKPGQAKVTVSFAANGTLELKNTTAGHNFPLADWQPCVATAGFCATLFGFWPSASPVCTTKAVDSTGSHAFIPFAPATNTKDNYIYPSGKWCVLEYGAARPFGSGADPLSPGASASTTWQAATLTSVLLDQTQFPALAAALSAGPTVWAVAKASASGPKDSFTPANCVPAAQTVLWSSSPITCEQLPS